MPRRMTQEEFEQRVKDYTNDSVQVISQYVNKKTILMAFCLVIYVRSTLCQNPFHGSLLFSCDWLFISWK